jgi:hypothetical protein
MVCRLRVTKVDMSHAIAVPDQPYVDPVWIEKFLKDCAALESLKIHSENLFAGIFNNQQWANLRVLHLQSCNVQDLYFEEFLVNHADTLEELDFDTVHLSPFVAMTLDAELLADKYDFQYPCWFEKFEVMQTKMPRLQTVKFKSLSQEEFVHPPLNQMTHAAVMAALNGGDHIEAEGVEELDAMLLRVFNKRRTFERAWRTFVWFPGTVSVDEVAEDDYEDFAEDFANLFAENSAEDSDGEDSVEE